MIDREVKVQSNSKRGGAQFKAGLREPKWPPAWLQNLPLKCPAGSEGDTQAETSRIIHIQVVSAPHTQWSDK